MRIKLTIIALASALAISSASALDREDMLALTIAAYSYQERAEEAADRYLSLDPNSTEAFKALKEMAMWIKMQKHLNAIRAHECFNRDDFEGN